MSESEFDNPSRNYEPEHQHQENARVDEIFRGLGNTCLVFGGAVGVIETTPSPLSLGFLALGGFLHGVIYSLNKVDEHIARRQHVGRV
jgi:hypothetical protein